MRNAIMRIALTLVALTAGSTAPAVTKEAPVGILVAGAGSPHRLSIISSYGCPHCRIFEQKAMDEIVKVWSKRGYEVEYVPFTLFAMDTATTIAAQCGPKSGFLDRTRTLFDAQSSISANWNGASDEAKQAASQKPRAGGADDVAKLIGLYGLAPALGTTQQKLKACMMDPAKRQGLKAMNDAATARWQIPGTPTVYLDGKKVSSSWPELRAELAKRTGK